MRRRRKDHFLHPIVSGDARMTGHSTAQLPQNARFVRQALALHQEGRLDEAARIYESILAADPDDFDALHLGGVLRHQQGHSVDALHLIAAALRTQPGSPDALTNYGVILDALRRHEEALDAFDRVLSLRS
jgi:tetratricopeptide (TPR) repeat protein